MLQPKKKKPKPAFSVRALPVALQRRWIDAMDAYVIGFFLTPTWRNDIETDEAVETVAQQFDLVGEGEVLRGEQRTVVILALGATKIRLNNVYGVL